MLAAVTRSPGEMVIEDVSGPGRARAGHVIVRPEAVGICGSDFHLEAGVLPRAAELVAAAGRVVVAGMSPGTAPLRPGLFPEKEIDVIGSSCATAADFREAIKLVTANRAAIAPLFSHHFPLARAAAAVEFAMSRPPDAIKIVVTVN